jgi:LIVCS family branched-chain amino acid:cation transporter
MNTNKIPLLTVSFAIFSMFFGAGNLIYPLEVGIDSGCHLALGMFGFLLTAVILPFTGLLAMILFDGNYHSFFNRLGKTTGEFLIFLCMMIIGPIVAIPRIITLSHIMIAPFIPWPLLQDIHPLSSFIFAVIFLAITFVATYRPGKIVEVIGNVITPALLVSLSIIIVKGLSYVDAAGEVDAPLCEIFSINVLRGYETLDLIASIFFASIVINILKSKIQGENKTQRLAITCFKAGSIGVGLLSVVYVGMGLLGVYHGHIATNMSMNSGELFSKISFAIMGSCGALVIATAVLMACLSTAIALSAVIARYTQITLCRNTISYKTALLITLIASIPLSTNGLSTVLALTGGPLVYVGYPVIIALTFCNILHKLCGMNSIRLPVIITFCAALISYLWR